MTLASFTHVTPPLRLFHGPDSLKALPGELKRVGAQRAVLVCGSTLGRSPMLEKVQAAMGELWAGTFAGVQGHSPVDSVEAAAEELRRLQADAVVAVGGGSAIVTARAASILLAEGKPVSELCTTMDADGRMHSPRLLAPKLPQFVLPTTPTTAIVKAGSAVFDTGRGQRLAMYDPKTRAHCVIIEPDLIQSAPAGLVSSAGVNTLALTMEGLTSKVQNPLADAALMHALRLVVRHLPDARSQADAQGRAQLVLAAILSGQGTDHTSAGVTMVLGHAIGARHAVDNGIINAIVLPHVLRFNSEAAQQGMLKAAGALGLAPGATGATEAIIDAVTAVFDALDMPRSLRDVGLSQESLPEIAALAMQDWFLRGNPRPVTEAAELVGILEAAW
ncbi:MAG: iron-containing alcohol dehydrogenase family protein [Burkholderiaceae bacterium]